MDPTPNLYVILLDLWIEAFLSPLNHISFIFLAFIVVPGMLFTILSYKPKKAFDYLAVSVFWIACGIAFLFSPFSIVICFAYYLIHKIFRKLKKGRHSTTTIVSPQNTAPISSEEIFFMESANGTIVQVPESKLEAWQSEQDLIRVSQETVKLTPAEEELKRRILDDLYGKSHGVVKQD